MCEHVLERQHADVTVRLRRLRHQATARRIGLHRVRVVHQRERATGRGRTHRAAVTLHHIKRAVRPAPQRDLGWLIQDAQSLVKGNHWYIGNAVGLFILPEGVSPDQLTSVHDLSFSYQSDNCTDQPQLSLTTDQRFQIKPVAGANAEPAMLQGRWQVRQLPYLELLPDGDQHWSYYLEISRKQQRDLIGEVQLLTLTPLQTYPVFGQCSFVFGLR